MTLGTGVGDLGGRIAMRIFVGSKALGMKLVGVHLSTKKGHQNQTLWMGNTAQRDDPPDASKAASRLVPL